MKANKADEVKEAIDSNGLFLITSDVWSDANKNGHYIIQA